MQFTRNVNLHLGELAAAPPDRAASLAAAIRDAGVQARAVDDIETVQWSKFVGWVALMALAVLTRAPTGRFLADPDVAAVAVDLIHEMAAIAAHRGVTIIDQSPVEVASIAAAEGDAARRLVRALGDRFTEVAPGHRMSSLQDLDAGRPLEVHETLGHARTLARGAGLATPTLDAVYRLVAAVDPARRLLTTSPASP